LSVRVKLTLRILNIKVGMVIVAKLNAHTKRRVTPNITLPIRYNIQPIIPCVLCGGGGGGGRTALMADVGEAKVFMMAVAALGSRPSMLSFIRKESASTVVAAAEEVASVIVSC
jgi:hypothetical protein